MRMLKNRKAVSPVVGVLLMVAVAVAAALTMYSWVSSMVTTQTATAGTQIKIDSVDFGNTSISSTYYYGINVTIRNTGTTAAVIKTIYITDANDTKFRINWDISSATTTPASIVNYTLYAPTNIVKPKNTLTFTINPSKISGWGATDTYGNSTWVPSSAYAFKVITDTGFYVEGTYYAPSSYPS